MILEPGFNPEIEKVIVLHEGLTNWFVQNQFWMNYFGLNHAGCLFFENSSIASYDIIVLSRMAHAMLTWIETDYPISDKDKARFAAEAIATVYEREKENLSEVGRMVYAIDCELTEKKNVGMSKTLQKRNGIKNCRPGKGHRKH